MKRLRPTPLKSAAAALSLLISPLHARVKHVDPTIGGVAQMLVPTHSGIGTEFTATERAGLFRFTFPEDRATLHLKNILPGALKVEGPFAVSGEERFHGMKAYIYGEFSQPVETAITPGDIMKLKATANTGTTSPQSSLMLNTTNLK